MLGRNCRPEEILAEEGGDGDEKKEGVTYSSTWESRTISQSESLHPGPSVVGSSASQGTTGRGGGQVLVYIHPRPNSYGQVSGKEERELSLDQVI